MSSPRPAKPARTGLDRFLERSLKNWAARQRPPHDGRERLLAAAAMISAGGSSWRSWLEVSGLFSSARLRGYSNMPSDMFSHAHANSRYLHPLWVLMT